MVTAIRPADTRSQRELLARLAGSGSEFATLPVPARLLSLAQFQATLPEDSAFVAYVDGGSRGALVWLSRNEARLLSASVPGRVRADVGGQICMAV